MSCACDSSSSSSSSSSDVPCLPCQELCACDINKIFRGAVVSIVSEFILLVPGINPNLVPTISLGPGNPAVIGTSGSNQRTDVLIPGNGTHIGGGYIVCSAAQCLLPPSVNGAVNRFPYNNNPLSAPGLITSQTISASRFLVTFYNLNGSKDSVVYEANLILVDGAGDLALLRVYEHDIGNEFNRCIEKDHPFIQLGRSDEMCVGDTVFLLGNAGSCPQVPYEAEGQRSIIKGNLAENKFLEAQGWVLPETIVVSAPVYSPAVGMPILNKQGRMIGMQTTSVLGNKASQQLQPYTPPIPGPAPSLPGAFNPFYQDNSFGMVMGPSSRFMNFVLRAALEGNCKYNYDRHLLRVNDAAGSYYRYMKGFAGICYRRVSARHYDNTFDYSLSGGYPIAGAPRVRISSDGKFLAVPLCKNIEGVQVLALAGDNGSDLTNGTQFTTSGLYSFPGVTNTVQTAPAPTPINRNPVAGVYAGVVAPGYDLVDSPFLGTLLPGDIVVAAGSDESQVRIGGLTDQTCLSNITWHMRPGDNLRVIYRRGNNFANLEGSTNDTTNAEQRNYNQTFSTAQSLAIFPALADYPWYNVGLFWLILAPAGTITSYPFFPVGSNNQSLNPQLPQGVNGAVTGFFHPAL